MALYGIDVSHHNATQVRTADHKEEVNQLRDAIQNNTAVMQRLLDRLGKE